MNTIKKGKLPYIWSARIPFIPHEVYNIADSLRQKDRWNTMVFLVGGAVRDYMYLYWQGGELAIQEHYKPKDFDMATNLSEEEILEMLRTPYAKGRGITVHEKKSVDTFGVVFVNCNGKDFEVAPFRKDVGSVDGRRPERVEKALIYDDAARRDLTVNSLYYDLHKQQILDFNTDDQGMMGQGIIDIKEKKVRTVGDPFERFEEDKLRVLRLVRFFSRYSDKLITGELDERTKSAIRCYSDLLSFKGMSHERIQMEFISGLKQCQKTSMYLLNYGELGLYPSVFPNMRVDWRGCAEKVANLKNPKVVLAQLLWDNKEVAKKLNELKYPNEMADPVDFLINAMSFTEDVAVSVVKQRDRRVIRNAKDALDIAHNESIITETRKDLTDLISTLDSKERIARIEHLVHYEPEFESGEKLMALGFQGPEIGKEQLRLADLHYRKSYAEFIEKR